RMFEQSSATPEHVSHLILELLASEKDRAAMRQALSPWFSPDAAGQIAERIMASLAEPSSRNSRENISRHSEDSARALDRIKSEVIRA
ncbi:MAG: hypothetical protein ABIV39_04420, partial [Verrucomicrobiota bacterium]